MQRGQTFQLYGGLETADSCTVQSPVRTYTTDAQVRQEVPFSRGGAKLYKDFVNPTINLLKIPGQQVVCWPLWIIRNILENVLG